MNRTHPFRRARRKLSALRAAHARDSQRWSRRIEGPGGRSDVTRW